MQRIFGAIAVFGAWISLPVSAIFGLVATDFMGLTLTEGRLPSYGVFGVPEVLVLGLLGAATILATVPIGTVVFSLKPGRWVYPTAAAMGILGLVLLFDELGRAHAAALLPGAAMLFVGAKLIEGSDDPMVEPAAAPVALSAAVAVAAPAAQPDRPPEPAAAGPKTKPKARSKAKPKAEAAQEPAAAQPFEAAASTLSSAPDGPVCPWCSQPIEPGRERCAGCGAALTEAPAATEEAIPGLTAVSPELRDWMEKSVRKARRPSLISVLMGEPDDRLLPVDGRADPSVFTRPSDAVRAAMAQLDEEIARSQIVGVEAAQDMADPPSEPETAPASAPEAESTNSPETAPAGKYPARNSHAGASPAPRKRRSSRTPKS